MLKERIAKIEEYFQGMEITNGVCIVKVHYKEKWGVYPSQDNNIKVAPSEEAPNEYFYYGDYEVVSFDNIFNLIEDTIQANIDAATKFALFQEKMDELKDIFGTYSLSQLQTLKFVFDEKAIVKQKRKYKRKPKQVEAEVSIEEQHVTDNIQDTQEIQVKEEEVANE